MIAGFISEDKLAQLQIFAIPPLDSYSRRTPHCGADSRGHVH